MMFILIMIICLVIGFVVIFQRALHNKKEDTQMLLSENLLMKSNSNKGGDILLFTSVAGKSNIAAYSDDGINWIQTTLPSTEYWSSVAYGNGRFVAVAGSGFNRPSTALAYSDDGINWKLGSMPSSQWWLGVSYGSSQI